MLLKGKRGRVFYAMNVSYVLNNFCSSSFNFAAQLLGRVWNELTFRSIRTMDSINNEVDEENSFGNESNEKLRWIPETPPNLSIKFSHYKDLFDRLLSSDTNLDNILLATHVLRTYPPKEYDNLRNVPSSGMTHIFNQTLLLLVVHRQYQQVMELFQDMINRKQEVPFVIDFLVGYGILLSISQITRLSENCYISDVGKERLVFTVIDLVYEHCKRLLEEKIASSTNDIQGTSEFVGFATEMLLDVKEDDQLKLIKQEPVPDTLPELVHVLHQLRITAQNFRETKKISGDVANQ